MARIRVRKPELLHSQEGSRDDRGVVARQSVPEGSSGPQLKEGRFT